MKKRMNRRPLGQGQPPPPPPVANLLERGCPQVKKFEQVGVGPTWPNDLSHLGSLPPYHIGTPSAEPAPQTCSNLFTWRAPQPTDTTENITFPQTI